MKLTTKNIRLSNARKQNKQEDVDKHQATHFGKIVRKPKDISISYWVGQQATQVIQFAF